MINFAGLSLTHCSIFEEIEEVVSEVEMYLIRLRSGSGTEGERMRGAVEVDADSWMEFDFPEQFRSSEKMN